MEEVSTSNLSRMVTIRSCSCGEGTGILIFAKSAAFIRLTFVPVIKDLFVLKLFCLKKISYIF